MPLPESARLAGLNEPFCESARLAQSKRVPGGEGGPKQGLLGNFGLNEPFCKRTRLDRVKSAPGAMMGLNDAFAKRTRFSGTQERQLLIPF